MNLPTKEQLEQVAHEANEKQASMSKQDDELRGSLRKILGMCNDKGCTSRCVQQLNGAMRYISTHYNPKADSLTKAEVLRAIGDTEYEPDGWRLLEEHTIPDCCPADEIVEARNILRAEITEALGLTSEEQP